MRRAAAALFLIPFPFCAAQAAGTCIRVERETPAVFEVVWKVTPDSVAFLRAAHQKLAEASGIRPQLAVCGSPEVNAHVVAGRVPEIRVDTGLLRFTQRPDELAAVLAHEFAHILMAHRAKKMEAAQEAYETAVRTGGTVRSFLESLTNFSRTAEREADDVGFKLAVKAGFAPGAARAFAQRMLQAGFPPGEGYLSTHPGLGERAWYSGRLAANENFHALAEEQLGSGDVNALERTVRAWKAQAPDSGGAAYYAAFAAVLAHRPPDRISSELEDAVSYFGIDDQSVMGEEYAGPSRDAAIALCVSLHREGQTIQALNCVKRLRSADVNEFRALTGWSSFLVLGRGRDSPSGSVFGAHAAGAPILVSSCKRVVQREGLTRAEPWRVMREPRRVSDVAEASPMACDPWLCDCSATSLEHVHVAE